MNCPSYLSRRLWLSPRLDADKDLWDKSLEDYYVRGASSEENTPDTLIRHLAEGNLDELSCDLQKQVAFLSSISNFHWYNQVRQDGTTMQSEPQVNNSQHLLHHPDSETEGALCKYKPCSPRHQVIDFLQNNLPLSRLVTHLLAIDRGEGVSGLPTASSKQAPKRCIQSVGDLSTDLVPDHPYAADIPVPPCPKKRKYGPRVKSVSSQDYCREAGIRFEQVISTESESCRSMYSTFLEDMVSGGYIAKRNLDCEYQVLIMNDYGITTGQMIPNRYVHLTVHTTQEGTSDEETLIKCTCQAYEQLQGTGREGFVGELEQMVEDAWLNGELTCMHARLYREELKSSNPNSNIMQILQPMPNPVPKVFLVDSVYLQSTTKFSVLGERNSFVHVWIENGKLLVQCQDSMCQAELKKKHRLQNDRGN